MKIGQTMPQIVLPAIDDSQFDTDSLKGKKYLVTFFRFATCPFCNMRLSELSHIRDELGEEFEIVAIFEAELEHLKKQANKHTRKFPILADKNRKYYELFDVKKSLGGMLKGMVLRLPTLIRAMFKGYFPHEVSSRFLTMPLSLLVDEKGIIQLVYAGKDEGDHLPLEQITLFARTQFN